MVTMTARQKILAFLARRSPASAAEIGHGLNMSAATVRHHLGILRADGRVVAAGAKKKGRRGRPDKTYRLSERVLGDNFDLLADATLSSWLDALTPPDRETAVRSLAESLMSWIGEIDQGLPASRRLLALTEKLSGLHYQAGWEAGAQGPRILFGHCPYSAIIARHPELCAMDASMLGAEMNAQVEQVSKIGAQPAGATHCVFVLRQHAGPNDQRKLR